jgi:hypothetical protein
MLLVKLGAKVPGRAEELPRAASMVPALPT